MLFELNLNFSPINRLSINPVWSLFMNLSKNGLILLAIHSDAILSVSFQRLIGRLFFKIVFILQLSVDKL